MGWMEVAIVWLQVRCTPSALGAQGAMCPGCAEGLQITKIQLCEVSVCISHGIFLGSGHRSCPLLHWEEGGHH